MKKPTVKLLMLIAGSVAYDFLFWKNFLGINALLFTILLVIYFFIVEPASFKNKKILVTAAGTLLAAVLVVTHNSITSIVALITSFTVITGFYLQPQLRSAFAAVPTGFLNFLTAPIVGMTRLNQLPAVSFQANSIWNILKLSFIPVVICYIFYWIYKFANPVFDTLSANFFADIGNHIASFFENISFERLLFILLGIIILTGILINSNIHYFMLWDNRSQDALEVNPTAAEETTDETPKPLFSIHDEYKMGMILLVLINILVLIVNIIDIEWLWHKIEFSSKLNLSQLVHQGTNLLILSILLSIGIMIFIFRGILNYHSGSNLLRYLAYAWIAQNAVMAISVAIRNYHYIYYYGLAYKRIGVLVFLTLTLFGLGALFIKIHRKKTLYFIVRTFSWAVYATMLCISLFNWDLIIAKHNTTHRFPENMDLYFLTSLSDKSLHIIAQHDSILDRGTSVQISYFRQIFNNRVERFMKREEKEKWQAWNYPEQVTYNYFLQHKMNKHE